MDDTYWDNELDQDYSEYVHNHVHPRESHRSTRTFSTMGRDRSARERFEQIREHMTEDDCRVEAAETE